MPATVIESMVIAWMPLPQPYKADMRGEHETSEEYLAEYVREKRPEIEVSIDYVFWKLARQMGDVIHDVCKMINGLTLDERKQMLLRMENGENEEENQS